MNQLNDDRKFVVVINTKCIPLVRHVIEIKEEHDLNVEEFKAWYYDIYHKLDNDRFMFCDSEKEMREIVEKAKEDEIV